MQIYTYFKVFIEYFLRINDGSKLCKMSRNSAFKFFDNLNFEVWKNGGVKELLPQYAELNYSSEGDGRQSTKYLKMKFIIYLMHWTKILVQFKAGIEFAENKEGL